MLLEVPLYTSVKAKLPNCGSSQDTTVVVKAALAVTPVGTGGIVTSFKAGGGPKSTKPVPAFGLNGLSKSSSARPALTSSRKVTALSLGSPLRPIRTCIVSIRESRVFFNCGSVLLGTATIAGNFVPVVLITPPSVLLWTPLCRFH